MDRRRKLLVNRYEELTELALMEVAHRWDAKVYAKIRVADALLISDDLTKEEYNYALMAHFDFVVARADTTPILAVEFDEPSHEVYEDAQRRDEMKNSICHKLGMPLLRVGIEHLRQVGRYVIISWLTECWFLYEVFREWQEAGELPYGEPFDYAAFINVGYLVDGHFVEPETEEEGARLLRLAETKPDKVQVKWTAPYDPFGYYRGVIRRMHEKGVTLDLFPELDFARDDEGYAVGVAFLRLSSPGQYIIGETRCKPLRYPPVTDLELSQQLVLVDIAEKLEKYCDGKYTPGSAFDVGIWRFQLKRWNERDRKK